MKGLCYLQCACKKEGGNNFNSLTLWANQHAECVRYFCPMDCGHWVDVKTDHASRLWEIVEMGFWSTYKGHSVIVFSIRRKEVYRDHVYREHRGKPGHFSR